MNYWLLFFPYDDSPVPNRLEEVRQRLAQAMLSSSRSFGKQAALHEYGLAVDIDTEVLRERMEAIRQVADELLEADKFFKAATCSRHGIKMRGGRCKLCDR